MGPTQPPPSHNKTFIHLSNAQAHFSQWLIQTFRTSPPPQQVALALSHYRKGLLLAGTPAISPGLHSASQGYKEPYSLLLPVSEEGSPSLSYKVTPALVSSRLLLFPPLLSWVFFFFNIKVFIASEAFSINILSLGPWLGNPFAVEVRLFPSDNPFSFPPSNTLRFSYYQKSF